MRKLPVRRVIFYAGGYESFRKAIEFAPAGSVQVGIGGDMALMQSPNDPIYWLHRAYVDKIWSRWQQRPSFGARCPRCGLEVR